METIGHNPAPTNQIEIQMPDGNNLIVHSPGAPDVLANPGFEFIPEAHKPSLDIPTNESSNYELETLQHTSTNTATEAYETQMEPVVENLDAVGPEAIPIGAGLIFGGLRKAALRRRIERTEEKIVKTREKTTSGANAAARVTGRGNEQTEGATLPRNSSEKRQAIKASRKAQKAKRKHGETQLRNFATSSGKPNKPNKLGIETHSIGEISADETGPFKAKREEANGKYEKKAYKKMDKADSRDRTSRDRHLADLEMQRREADEWSRTRERKVSALEQKLDKLDDKLEDFESR